MAMQFMQQQNKQGLRTLGRTASSTGNKTTQPTLQQPTMSPQGTQMPAPRQQIDGDAAIDRETAIRQPGAPPQPPGNRAMEFPVLAPPIPQKRVDDIIPPHPTGNDVFEKPGLDPRAPTAVPVGTPPVMEMDPTRQPPAPQQTTQPVTPGGGDPHTLTPGQDAVGLENLRGLIERYLAQPSAFNLPEVSAARDMFRQRQADEAALATQGIEADAAQRGLTFSTVPTTNLGTLQDRLAQNQAQFDTELQTRTALQHREDLGRAIQSALQFGQLQQQGELGRGQLALGAGQLGFAGSPDINEILRAIAMLAGGAG